MKDIRKTNELNILRKFLPEGTEEYVYDLLKEHPVQFKIVRPRKTKLGDFKVVRKVHCSISVNSDLEPLNFLVTTLHEIAHLHNWLEHKDNRNIAPHGKEWKAFYKALFKPLLHPEHSALSQEEKDVLLQHINNPKASSCSDRVLNDYLRKDDVVLVKDLSAGDRFILQNKVFTIEKKLRTRYLCEEHFSKKKYYIHGMAEITPLTKTID